MLTSTLQRDIQVSLKRLLPRIERELADCISADAQVWDDRVRFGSRRIHQYHRTVGGGCGEHAALGHRQRAIDELLAAQPMLYAEAPQ